MTRLSYSQARGLHESPVRLQRRVRARHRHHLRLLREQVLGPVASRSAGARTPGTPPSAANITLHDAACTRSPSARSVFFVVRARRTVAGSAPSAKEAGEREPVGVERGRRRRLASSRAAASAASNFSHSRQHVQDLPEECPAVSHVYATSSGTPSEPDRIQRAFRPAAKSSKATLVNIAVDAAGCRVELQVRVQVALRPARGAAGTAPGRPAA